MGIPLEAEAWTWYGVVMLVVVARFTARFMQFKTVKKLQWEDFCMAVVAMLYTTEIVLLIKSNDTPTNLIPPGQFDPTDKDQIALEVYGSKLIVALEMVYCAAIWGCKGCLLLFYANMTYALPQNAWTKMVAVYAFGGYILMVILYMGVWCRPFYNYWSVPAANPQCSTAENHLIVNFVFNVTSDLLMMLIPLPMLIKTNLPLRKKLVLCAVFSLGMFCILSAVLNKYYSFTSPYGSEWVYWYVREVSTAVIVANIPHLWALVRKTFRLPSFISNTPDSRMSQDPPHRFFEHVADPLGSTGPRRKRRDITPAQLEGVDIDEFMADIERGPDESEAAGKKLDRLRRPSTIGWAMTRDMRTTSSNSDLGTLVADQGENPISPLSAHTPRSTRTASTEAPDTPRPPHPPDHAKGELPGSAEPPAESSFHEPFGIRV